MIKSLLAITTAVFALATIASTAEAGFKVRLGHGGPFHKFNAHHNSHDYGRKTYRKRAHRKIRREKAYVAKKTSKIAVQAQAPKTDTANVDWENSSITTANGNTVETAESPETRKPLETAAIDDAPKSTDCRKFFPSVGMVVSVPCE